jgi:hypothetical protein
MNEQKSEGSQLFHNKGYLDETAGRALRGLWAERATGHSVTPKRERIDTTHKHLVHFVAPAMRSCITQCTRVQYNIDVVKRTPKLLVRDAV